MKKILKRAVYLLSVLILINPAFSQEKQSPSDSTQTEIIEKKPAAENGTQTESVKKKPSPFGFYLGTGVVVSRSDKEEDPPAGAAFNFGGEYEYRFAKYGAINPSVDFSFFHYGWTGKKAAITEIENRTALTFNLLTELPLMMVIDIKQWTVSFGGGIGFLIRFGVLEPGVKPKERTPGSSLTAAEELGAINRYFWQNGRFFYPTLRFKTEYTFTSGWKTGLQIKTALPIFNAWDKAVPKPPFADGMLIQIGVILHPAQRY